MSFLSMAPWQAWSLLGLTATAIIVIFFLRIQHRRVVVSSSLLWERVLERRKRRSWLELLRRLISLLIALAIGLSLVLSFTEAETGAVGGEPRQIALVIDTSLGMAARTADGSSRFERAIELAAQLMAGGSGADSFTIYDSGGRVASPASRDRDTALSALERLRPLSAEFRFPELEEGIEAWLITDGVAATGVPSTTRVITVFEPADNVGVSAFEIRATPTDPFRHEAFLEVGNFSSSSQEVLIVLRDEQQVQFRRTVELAPNQFYQNTFDLSPLDRGVLEARVESDTDALGIDNQAWVFLPQQGTVRVLLVGDSSSAIAEVLVAQEQVEVEVVDGEAYEQWRQSVSQGGLGAMAAPALSDPAGYDGIIFETYTPAQAPPLPALMVRPVAAEWLPLRTGSISEPEQLVERRADPLLQFVDWHDVKIESADRVDAARLRVLIDSEQGPLLLVGAGTAPWVMTTFDLQESDFAQSLGFPIFLGNLMEWFRGAATTLRATPGDVAVPLRNAAVVTPTGELAETRPVGDRTFVSAVQPGVYMARGGVRTLPIIVSANGRQLSSINQRRLTIEPTPLEELPRGRSLWRILLPLVAALLVLEGLTYHRRITV